MLKKLLCCLALSGCSVISNFDDYRFEDGNNNFSDASNGYDASMVDSMRSDSNIYNDAKTYDGGTGNDSSINWNDSGINNQVDSGYIPMNCFSRPCEIGTCTTVPCDNGIPGICRRCLL